VWFGADTGVMRANVSRMTKVSNRMVRAKIVYSIFATRTNTLASEQLHSGVNQREPSLTAAGGREREFNLQSDTKAKRLTIN